VAASSWTWTNAEQAQIAENAGIARVMELEPCLRDISPEVAVARGLKIQGHSRDPEDRHTSGDGQVRIGILPKRKCSGRFEVDFIDRERRADSRRTK